MWVKQCHKPAHGAQWFITKLYKTVMTGGWFMYSGWWLYTHPSEKYESIGMMMIPNISGKMPNWWQPNHQPASNQLDQRKFHFEMLFLEKQFTGVWMIRGWFLGWELSLLLWTSLNGNKTCRNKCLLPFYMNFRVTHIESHTRTVRMYYRPL